MEDIADESFEERGCGRKKHPEKDFDGRGYEGRIRRKSSRLFSSQGLRLYAGKNPDGTKILLLTSKLLEETGFLRHAFSTRIGGVSGGVWESMNLSFTRGDSERSVRENFRRIALQLGTTEERLVMTHQTHSLNVRAVTEKDAGKGICRERDYRDVDALMTDVPGLALGVFWADCVPLLFADPVKRVIAVAHSGWRGTAGRIGEAVVRGMQERYGCCPADLLSVIGPSICGDCYEVSSDVAERFREAFPEEYPLLLREKEGKNGKFLLDLRMANRCILERAGLRRKNISETDICTCCNPELLFSHRHAGEERGNNGAFLMLQG